MKEAETTDYLEAVCFFSSTVLGKSPNQLFVLLGEGLLEGQGHTLLDKVIWVLLAWFACELLLSSSTTKLFQLQVPNRKMMLTPSEIGPCRTR